MARDYSGLFIFGGIGVGLYWLYKHLESTCALVPGTNLVFDPATGKGVPSNALCSLYNGIFSSGSKSAPPLHSCPSGYHWDSSLDVPQCVASGPQQSGSPGGNVPAATVTSIIQPLPAGTCGPGQVMSPSGCVMASVTTQPSNSGAYVPPPPSAISTPGSLDCGSAFCNQLLQAMEQQVNRAVGTVSEWNWVLMNIVNPVRIAQSSPFSPAFPLEELTTSDYPPDQLITVGQYVTARNAAGIAQGVSGLGWSGHHVPGRTIHRRFA